MGDELVRKAIDGDREAFCELYSLYKDRLYRYALYRLRNAEDAEDVVSDCVLQAWRGISGLRKPEAFAAWIFRILSACCSRRIKEIAGERGNLTRIYSEGFGCISEHPGRAAEIAEALSVLGNEERDIVLMSVIAGFSSREIAALTGLTPGSVRSKLSRSLKKMKAFLS